jgi:hypothetical protein
MRDRGLTLGQAIDDAVQLVDIWGLGYCGIDASLAGGEVPAIQSTAHRASFKQSVLKWVPAGGIGLEGHRRERYKRPAALRHGFYRVGWWLTIVCIAPPVTQAATEARLLDPSLPWPWGLAIPRLPQFAQDEMDRGMGPISLGAVVRDGFLGGNSQGVIANHVRIQRDESDFSLG